MSRTEPPAAEPPGLRPLRVLLIEDDPDDAVLLHRHLTRAGYTPLVHRVETAENMLEALNDAWDCVLADYHLPVFSAPEALRLLKTTGQDIPFIMMSGAVSEETAVSAMRAGAHDYVSKENLARLVPAVEREIAEATARRMNRATEQALRSSEARFHRLVEGTPLALLISDMSGVVVYSNSSVEKLFGLPSAAGDTHGFTLAGIFPEKEPLAHLADKERAAHLAQALRTDLTLHAGQTWETTCRRADGTPVTALIGAAALNPEAAPCDLQLAVFFVDLTEQKRGEEVLRRTEKLAAAGRLAAAIAHEINNPLEAITNCMYLLAGGRLDPDSRSYLEMAQRELDRVTHITTQTLRFYRQSSGPGPTDIGELFDSVLTLFESRLRDNSIEITRDYTEAPSIVALDGEIRQVLANLVGNAVDAMSGCAGPRRLILRARSRRLWTTSSPGLSIMVADTGTGMSNAVLARIYEPFFSTKGITGTGLGLWVTREIVGKHNGLLKVSTRETAPSGTVFRLLLPVASSLSKDSYESGLPILT